MGKIINSYILPHPPVIVPEVGQGRERDAYNTIEAVKRAAKEIGKDNPSTVIISTPHAPGFRDHVYLSTNEILEGDFKQFGTLGVRLEFQNNELLVKAICEAANKLGISAGGLSRETKEKFAISDKLDHGALVPLYFIQKELKNFKIVHISTPFMKGEELYKFGKCIADAVRLSNENVVYIASGDLSHRLTEDAPAGYSPVGSEYDQYLITKLKEEDAKQLLNTSEEFMEAAGECGTRSIMIMLGALNSSEYETEIFSYEGPFGVGYLVAKLNVTGEKTMNDDKHVQYYEEKESDYVRLARETLEAYVRDGKRLIVPDWVTPELLNRRAGVFVSLKKNGQLRGCIGTISAFARNIAEEIMSNAISSGTRDPRFEPVKADELSELEYSVDVLGDPEKISTFKELNVKKYGVIVSSGMRRGLLLPDLEGVDTPEVQVSIALQKAGINKTENYEMERFEVIRYH